MFFATPAGALPIGVLRSPFLSDAGEPSQYYLAAVQTRAVGDFVYTTDRVELTIAWIGVVPVDLPGSPSLLALGAAALTVTGRRVHRISSDYSACATTAGLQTGDEE